jgi:predicted acetyltransferase
MMTKNAERPLGHLEVIPAALEQEPILANLLELYVHDFSEFHQVELGLDGRFGYRNLPLYWRDPDRHPFLVMLDGKPAGFVLVKQGSEISGDASIWDLAEFFVLRGHRRRGMGTAIAHEVWRRSPGRWEVRVMDSNHGARCFWERAIADFTGGAVRETHFEKGGELWRVFSFESPCAR